MSVMRIHCNRSHLLAAVAVVAAADVAASATGGDVAVVLNFTPTMSARQQ